MAGRGGDPRVRKRRRSARKSPGDGRCNAADLHIRDRRIRGGYHLMAGQSERVHFTDGDRLDLRTLAAEQTFHLEAFRRHLLARSEEHTSELQSLMRISYAVFCL